MKRQPIGILDSGVGGLSVYREIVRLLPHESTVYIGDNAFAPYGRMSQEEVYERAKKVITFLHGKNVKLVVVACNTITVSGIDLLRKDFPQTTIIGTVPVIKTAGATTQNGRIGVLSTTRTAASEYQKKLIAKFANGHQVFTHGTDKLVPLIEQGKVESEEMQSVLKEFLADFQNEKIDTLVLGSTHFPFLRDVIQPILGERVQLLDSGEAVARQVKRVLTEQNTLIASGNAQRAFYTTGDSALFDVIAKKLLGVTIASARVTL